jgi:hypothetical protein
MFTDHCNVLEKFVCYIGNSELSNKMESYRTDQKGFVIESFTSLVLLWRDNNIEGSPFVLHHRETLLVGFLKSLKKLEV